jgi:hypothetical protein
MHNVGDDVPFDFDERLIDPTGRVVRTVAGVTATPAPKPRRDRRRRMDADHPDLPLTELLKLSIREVLEREIREANDEDDLSRLLIASIEDIRRRRKKESK